MMHTQHLLHEAKRTAMQVATFAFFTGYAAGFLMGACAVWFYL